MAETRQMGLSECAKYDHDTNARGRLTGWGVVSKERREKGISRKARREQKQAESRN